MTSNINTETGLIPTDTCMLPVTTFHKLGKWWAYHVELFKVLLQRRCLLRVTNKIIWFCKGIGTWRPHRWSWTWGSTVVTVAGTCAAILKNKMTDSEFRNLRVRNPRDVFFSVNQWCTCWIDRPGEFWGLGRFGVGFLYVFNVLICCWGVWDCCGDRSDGGEREQLTRVGLSGEFW